MLPEVDQLWR